jgi:hypothetical protein
MPDISVPITKYQYEFRSINGENAAFLYLFDDSKLLCMAAFVERTCPLPGPRESINGVVFLSFYRSDLDGIIDMLRNEKPVMFNWSSENHIAQITTGPEPVGEEEGSHIASVFGKKKPAARKSAKKSALKRKMKTRGR